MNLVLNQENNLYLISLSILVTSLLDDEWIYREKLQVNHFWEFKG